MKEKNISIYRLAKSSGIPYTTLNDICNGRTHLEQCSAKTVRRLAVALDVSMETLLAPAADPHKSVSADRRASFELYRSNIRRRLRELGDIPFLAEALGQDLVSLYYQKKWYPECLYLLAMIDHISRLNRIPLCEDYEDLRRCRLSETIYPFGILSLSATEGSDQDMAYAAKTSLSEFRRFNIAEREVRNVV